MNVAYLAGALGAFVFGALVYKNKWHRLIPTKGIILASAALIGCYGLYIFFTQLAPATDQAMCFNIATAFLNGDYTAWNRGNYAQYYPHQNSLILYFALLQKLFGQGNFLAVQFINLLFAIMTAYYLAALSQKLLHFSSKSSIMLALLCFAPMMLYIVFVYGTLPGLGCALAGLYYGYCFLHEKKLRFCVYSSLFFSVAGLFKSNYMIFAIAMGIVYLFVAVYTRSLRPIIAILLLVGTYLLASFLVAFFIAHTIGFQPAEGMPTATWVAIGMQEGLRAPGWYNVYAIDTFTQHGFDAAATKQQVMADIAERIVYFSKNPAYAFDFFKIKTASIWIDSTFQSLWFQGVMNSSIELPLVVKSLLQGGTLAYLYEFVYGFIQPFVFLCSLLFLVKNRRSITVQQLIFGIIFIGGFLFHIFWEGKSQYTVVYFFLLIPYAIKGYQQTVVFLAQKWAARKNAP